MTAHPWADVIKLVTAVIYGYFMAVLSSCVVKLHYLVNYSGMAVNYHGKKFYYINHGGKLKYPGNLPWYFNPSKSRVKITAVNYCRIFMTLAPFNKFPRTNNFK